MSHCEANEPPHTDVLARLGDGFVDDLLDGAAGIFDEGLEEEAKRRRLEQEQLRRRRERPRARLGVAAFEDALDELPQRRARRFLREHYVSANGTQRIRKHGLRAELEPLWAKIPTYTGRAYLHIDLDVLDPAEARVNQFAAPGGLTLTELLGILSLVRERFTLAAAAITAYDPEYDEGEKAVRAAVAIIRELSKQI